MSFAIIKTDDYEVTLWLPDEVTAEEFHARMGYPDGVVWVAPVDFRTGAVLAQTTAPVTPGPPKGTGAGAKSAPVRQESGAPVAPAPSRAGPVSASVEDRISYYRSEIKALAQAKVDLTPAFDQHGSTLQVTRDKLKESHDAYPLFGSVEITVYRLQLHDQLLAASIKWGRQAREYRETVGLIKIMSAELDRLVSAKPKGQHT